MESEAKLNGCRKDLERLQEDSKLKATAVGRLFDLRGCGEGRDLEESQ